MQTNNTTNNGRTPAMIAYFTLIGTIVAFYMNQDEKKTSLASFHIRQALGVHISFYILGALVSLFDSWPISSAFYVFILVLWVFGLITALQQEEKPTPILGPFFQQWFTFIK
ncbi:hypothetical protein ACE939_07210 [Aquimarina sp. W85]|uniref:hypothetical protein n=1 Tax=Aquimarina rhodophyticola TaxID=3342246 RepID=UPI003670CC0D